jgi:hypothetical protein
MGETAEWHAARERFYRFQETELGRLFAAYSKATIDYWRMDLSDTIGHARLAALDGVYKEAHNTFVAKLMELANV